MITHYVCNDYVTYYPGIAPETPPESVYLQQLQSVLTMDLLMWVSLLFALLSANSRLLMSFRRALYLLICSLMISSTHLQYGGEIHLQQKQEILLWTDDHSLELTPPKRQMVVKIIFKV